MLIAMTPMSAISEQTIEKILFSTLSPPPRLNNITDSGRGQVEEGAST
jgi:hypothetical protein